MTDDRELASVGATQDEAHGARIVRRRREPHDLVECLRRPYLDDAAAVPLGAAHVRYYELGIGLLELDLRDRFLHRVCLVDHLNHEFVVEVYVVQGAV